MSQRSNRPRSWCPRGDSPMRLPEGSPLLPSPVAAPGVPGLPPAVASPRSTPTPFKLRRFSMGADRAGSPCSSNPGAASVLQMTASQLEQHMAATQAAKQAAINLQQQQQQHQFSAQNYHQQSAPEHAQQNSDGLADPLPPQQQQSGVFYPMPQHPASPSPLPQQKTVQDMQRPYRHSPILFRDPGAEPRSPPTSRPGSVVLRDRDPNSPTPGSRPTSALLRERDPWSPTPASLARSDRDPRSPTPAKPSPLVQGERDFRSPTPSRPFPFRQKDRNTGSPVPARPRPTSLHLPKDREPWSPSRASPLTFRERDTMSPVRPSPLAQKERDPMSPARPSPLAQKERQYQEPRSPTSPRPSSLVFKDKQSRQAEIGKDTHTDTGEQMDTVTQLDTDTQMATTPHKTWEITLLAFGHSHLHVLRPTHAPVNIELETYFVPFADNNIKPQLRKDETFRNEKPDSETHLALASLRRCSSNQFLFGEEREWTCKFGHSVSSTSQDLRGGKLQETKLCN
ncbi:vegetative cell wall protein gp1-like [Penaeus japonicus]|uniref:vegetative cell wall protein gp1-like n=1 Tax=Penaeus japonicus TaxID=27405 RepID=UPI001C714F0D|nr:vegetative cell wall protein gp1-like [Penaeus japonicus]